MITRCGGKTFVLGEYSALHTGQGLLLTLPPYFEAEFSLVGRHDPINPPCKRFIHLHADVLAHMQWRFRDPYQGRGGLGASSAAFLFWYRAWLYFSGQPPLDLQNKDHVKRLLTYFKQTHWDGIGVMPSGLDVLAQNRAGLVWVDAVQGLVSPVSWPFHDVGVCLMHTGKKVATHKHLCALDSSASYARIAALTQKAYKALCAHDKLGFIHAINTGATHLFERGLMADHTHAALVSARTMPFFLAGKGCGALGADVILICYRLDAGSDIQRWAHAQGMSVLSQNAVGESSCTI